MTESFDSERAKEALRGAVCEVMADLAFLDAEPLPDGARTGEPLEFRVAIDALKPMSCRIEILCPSALIERIVEILFCDDAGKEPEQVDSILEIANVVAGKFLSAYFGRGAEIKLELPRYVFSSDGGEVIASLDFDAEGIPFRAALSSIRYRY